MGKLAVVLGALAALAPAAQAHIARHAFKRHHAGATITATCPAGVPVQTLTVANGAHVRAFALTEVERAVETQSVQLRAAWGTPCVRFGPGGWEITLSQGCAPSGAGGMSCSLAGEHLFNGRPYAKVTTGALTYTYWSRAFSHEIAEMLVDPSLTTRWRLGLMEVCDPVENLTYQVDGLPVSDFVLPSYSAGGPGPWDRAGALTAPLS